MVKLIFSELKRKIKFINKRRRHTKNVVKKVFDFFNLKDFLFYKYICEVYNLANIRRNCKKSRFMYEQRRRRLKNFSNKKLLFFKLKDFIFYKHICKMYTL